ncbi:von Willebrand factor A domain-containing protein 7-like [Haliotis asinina]|uniref:von Willebrand factor A domain-containing protein 7-like n=1 Tax=Haliotis asinina TaxID=109174 RepID=UPI0035325D12
MSCTYPLLFVLCILRVDGFFPNRLTSVPLGDNTWTHEDITEQGILQAVAAYFEANNTRFAERGLSQRSNLTASYLFRQYYGEASSAPRLRAVIKTIVNANNKVDLDHPHTAAWHCNGEEIRAANNLMVQLREDVIKVLQFSNPSYDLARELIGQYLHILQMFYSNTNWVEIMGATPYASLGIRGKVLYAQATPEMDTCRSCGSEVGTSCDSNILLHTTTDGVILTSGYKSRQDKQKPFRDSSTNQEGKCSHGGPYDVSGLTSAALGGINKDSALPSLSPHYKLHQAAAEAAIQHTAYFLHNSENGIRAVIGDVKYQRLLQLKLRDPFIVLIDRSSAMRNELSHIQSWSLSNLASLPAGLDDASNYLIATFKTSSVDSTLIQTNTASRATQIIRRLGVGSFATCSRRSYMRSLIKGTSRLTRKKRSSSGQTMFPSLARSTGGWYYNIQGDSTDYYPPVLRLLKDSTSISRVIIHRSLQLIYPSSVSFKVDNTIPSLTVKVKARYSSEPAVTLRPPQGSARGSSSYLKSGIKLIQVEQPAAGTWVLEVPSSSVEVEVSGESPVDVSAQFARTDLLTHLEYPFVRRPLSGSNTTLAVTVTGSEVDFLVSASFTQSGSVVSTYSFSSEDVIKRLDGQLTYRKTVIIPQSSFVISFEGQTKTGHRFQRVIPTTVVPMTVDIDMFAPLNVSVYMNRQATVPFQVSKESEGDTDISVSVQTDLQVSATVTTNSFNIHGARAAAGVLTLSPGSSELTTTLVALATTTQTSALQQYDIARYLVQRWVTKAIDNTPPICTIISTTGSCDADKIDPCSCNDFKWTGTATLTDVGSGIYNVSASVNGSRGSFVYVPAAAALLSTATISSDCCNAVSYIIAVDRDSNTGVCKFDLAPGLEKSSNECTSSDTEKQAVGRIVGGIIGGLLVLGVLVLALLVIRRRKKLGKIDRLLFVFRKNQPYDVETKHSSSRTTTPRAGPVSHLHGNTSLSREIETTVVTIHGNVQETSSGAISPGTIDYHSHTAGTEVNTSTDIDVDISRTTDVDISTSSAVDNPPCIQDENSVDIDVDISADTVYDNSADYVVENSAETAADSSADIVDNTADTVVDNTADYVVDNSADYVVDNSAETAVDSSADIVDNTADTVVDNSAFIESENSADICVAISTDIDANDSTCIEGEGSTSTYIYSSSDADISDDDVQM